MEFLNTRIPPPVVTLLCAWGMSWVAHHSVALEMNSTLRLWLAVVLFAAAILLMSFSVVLFAKSKTTINPMQVGKTSTLVSNGPFAFSRNPIYLADVILLLSWAIFLSSPAALLGPIAFVIYISQFQIKPEEKMLRSKFGQAYATYEASVRRWL